MDRKQIAKSIEDLALAIENEDFGKKPTIAISNTGSELSSDVINKAIDNLKDDVDFIIVGENYKDFKTYNACGDVENAEVLEKLFENKEIDAAITLHYPFPIGVSTVGKIITPAEGKEVFIANTTGTSDVKREKAMILNAIDGIIAAKANGIENPKVGILNVEGARLVDKKLKELKDNGFEIEFAESKRADKGSVLRGNDLVAGVCDVFVTDSLTGNIIIKVFSSFTSGGYYETTGCGYGPSIGKDYDKPVFIISRRSGTPLIEGAIKFAKKSVEGNIVEVSKKVYQQAEKAGLNDILSSFDKQSAGKEEKKSFEMPDKEIVTAAIGGVDILEIEDAIESLLSSGIYAESAMGCTGPVVMVNENNEDKAKSILGEKGYI
ncbi:MAG: glycine/sarcosine/betaine reductase complex component C subunit alpha [Tissierellia bacterium]|nr:glycine/sarcosine/betaine reductase complex component C subunit alpha [Tissierellia bacterium]